MADYTTIVDPGNAQTANGDAWDTDYTSLSAWEAGEDGLYTSSDKAIADCRRSTSAEDTNSVTVYGFVATPIIMVHEDYRHEGKWANTRDSDSNYIYKLLSSSTDVLRPAQDMEIDGLLIQTTGAYKGIEQAGTVTTVDVKNTIIDGNGSTGSGISGDYSGTINCYNVIVFGFSTSSGGYGIAANSSSSVVNCYNCTVQGGRYGYLDLSGLVTVNNCLGVGCTSACYAVVGTSSDYNVSSDTTAVGTNNEQSKTAYTTYFEDYASDDFHLTDTSLVLFGLSGDDLSATFTDDIDGDIRSNWDIGADEYVAAGGSPLLPNMLNAAQPTRIVQ